MRFKPQAIRGLLGLCILALAFVVQSTLADEAKTAPAASDKPKIAFLPLGGDASEELRAKVAFSLRQKLDRTKKYEVLDGYAMNDLASESKEPITFATGEDVVRKLAKFAEASIVGWGELVNAPAGPTLRLKVLDLTKPDAKPREYEKVIAEATDLRFVSEQILETLPGVEKFEHVTEQSVWDDAKAKELWEKNPNLVSNGDFTASVGWEALLESQKYTPPVSDKLPAVDKVVIYREPAEKSSSTTKPSATRNQVLAMNLSRWCAENNGMACLGDSIAIEPNTRYRLQFRYKSDGPSLHIFVKGYTMAEDIKGKKTQREIYRRQVPPSGATDGKWVTVIDDLNPQQANFPIQYLRIDLYAYLSPGIVMFDDIELKAVGAQTRKAKDEAIDKVTTRPKNARD